MEPRREGPANGHDSDMVVLIPALNEEGSLRDIVTRCRAAMNELRGWVIVVDDGSTDASGSVAEAAGAIVIRHRRNRGVAQAVKTGLARAIDLRPKVVVQLDADGQHAPEDIVNIARPVIDGEADLVLGRRVYTGWKPAASRRFGNRLLTAVTNHLAGTSVKDAQSGFRAMAPEVARELNLTSRNTYVGEMIIRAAREGFRIAEVDVKVGPRKEGKSRAVRSLLSYASGAIITLVRVYRDYEPLRFFGGIGGAIIALGVLIGLLLLLPAGMLPWLANNLGFRTVFLLITVGLQIVLFGFLADMMGNR